MTPRRRPPTKLSRPRRRTDEPRAWLLLASSSSTLSAHADAIRDLAAAGHVVRLGFRAARVPQGFPVGRHRLGTLRSRAARGVTSLLSTALPAGVVLTVAARHDRWLAEVAPTSDEVVFLDERAGDHLRARVTTLAPGARVWSPAEAGRLLAEEAAWRSLIVGARELDERLPHGQITLSRVLDSGEKLAELSRTGSLRTDLARDVRPELRRLSRWALRRGHFDKVDSLLEVGDLLRHLFGPDRREEAAATALRSHVALVRDVDPGVDILDAVRAVLDEADALLDDDIRDAAELAAIALGLLFHQQLHTARAQTPLVNEPERFLAPLRDSRVGRLLASSQVDPLGPESLLLEEADADPLAAPAAAETRPAAPPGRPLDRVRVSVHPGVYANHAAPLLAALAERDDVALTTVQPPTVSFRGMMIDAPLLQYRLEHALGRTPTVSLGVTREDYDAVVDADILVADWADKGAVWASTVVPRTTRMVVRVHSVDALSGPAHLVDWSRVDDLVFVADHIRDLFVAILGERVAHVRTHVVTNIVSPASFPDPLLPVASRTLGMVGWAQVVKDPCFALDVLEHLLEHDDSWRLRLIGADFADHHAARANAYSAEFRERALQPHLVDHIDYTGFTRDLPRHLRHVGFVLSTSLREGCPVGTLEGTAAGAFPVVRDWPAFAPLDGAGRLFPRRCVVQTPREAADLILSLADEGDRRRAVQEVRLAMSDQFSDAGTTDRLLEIILSDRS